MRAPTYIVIWASVLAVVAPGRFLKFQERVAKPRGIAVSGNDESVTAVHRAFKLAASVVALAALSGSLLGLGFRHYLGSPSQAVLGALQLIGALVLLLATLYVRADTLRTYHGETLIELVDRAIYSSGYFLGTTIIVASLVWPW